MITRKVPNFEQHRAGLSTIWPSLAAMRSKGIQPDSNLHPDLAWMCFLLFFVQSCSYAALFFHGKRNLKYFVVGLQFIMAPGTQALGLGSMLLSALMIPHRLESSEATEYMEWNPPPKKGNDELICTLCWG